MFCFKNFNKLLRIFNGNFIIGNVESNIRTITSCSNNNASKTLYKDQYSLKYNHCTLIKTPSNNLNNRIYDFPMPFSLIFDLPPIKTIIPLEPLMDNNVKEAPSAVTINNNEKQAARLIVIRRRKMKKHKLRKLRKRMKFEWAKVRQKRELRKEKEFQAVLLSQIKEAEKFDPEQYVKEKIRLAKEKPIPRFWNGRKLPEFLIKQYLGIK